VGSILEYRIRIHGIFMPRWDLQTAYFIHKEHFAFKPNSNIGGYWTIHDKPVNRLAATKTPVDAQIAIQTTKNQFVVDLNDVPPVPDDDWMPPINTLRWHVGFYYTYAATGKEFWDTEAKFWAQDVNEFTKVSGTIRNAANSLIAPGDTEDQKARKIYAAVEKLENTDYTHVRSDRERKKEKIKEIHSVEDVWKNRIGSGNALALLYVALAQAAGLKAWPMQVVDRSNAFFDGSNMNTDQFDDFIAIVSLGGKEVFLDPGEKVCPFGVLHWTHSLSAGFRESDTGPTLSQTPGQTYVGNHVQRVANLMLEADGSLTGTARIVMTGAEAIYWRQLALENDEGELKKKFEESLNDDLPEGVTAAFDHFVGLDDPEVNLMATVNLTGSLGAPAGKRLILPGLIFESRAKHPFVAEDKRTIPIDVHYPRMETDEAVLRLPEGYTVESSPKTADVSWPGYAALRINSETKDNTLDVARVFARNFSLLKPETYNDLHDFYLKLASADQQQIVLVRAAAAKGN
jgi:hypothetical protein